jgi:hypothetical protein
MPRFSRDPVTHSSQDRSRVLHVSRSQPTVAVHPRSGGKQWTVRSGATGKRPAGSGRKRGNRPNASQRAEARDRESTQFEWRAPRRPAAARTGKRPQTARQGARRPPQSFLQPGNGTQSTNLRHGPVKNAGRGEPTRRTCRRNWNRRQDLCGTRPDRTTARRGSNAPQPSDRGAHGSPSWPANSRQATKQRKSALSQPSSTLEPAVRWVIGQTHPSVRGNLIVLLLRDNTAKMKSRNATDL